MNVLIQGQDFKKYLKINQHLTINNLKAFIGYEVQRDVVLVINGSIIDGPLLIKEVLYDNALITIKEQEETDEAAQ